GKSASTPIDTEKPLLKDSDGEDVDVHTYRHKLLLFCLAIWYYSVNAVSYIKYALTENPHIYVSCIKQFWNTVTVKQSTDITRLQALVDKKKVVILEAEDKPTEVEEVVEFVTIAKLITEVTAASTPVSAASITILAVEPQVPAATPTIEDKPAEVEEVVEVVTIAKLITEVTAASTPKTKRSVIRDLEEKSTAIIPGETKSKEKGKGIMVEDPKPIKKKQQVELDEEYARKLHEELNKDIDWDTAIEHMKQKAKEDKTVQRYQVMKKRPRIEAQSPKFNTNIEFLLKSKEKIEEEENRAVESINETLAQKAAKRRKLNEEVKDDEDLKQHLEIVPDEDDDVYTEATPLARKVPVVDYQII
nr:hypothetical protein [Tanacetum cinerariifolium]